MDDMRTLFISDTHLGSKYAQTGELLEFLSEIKNNSVPEKLYLVGDFIDGWKLKRSSWYWDDKCNLVIRKILSLVKRGTEVIYVAGNHDEFIRDLVEEFNFVTFGNIRFGDEFVHRTAKGDDLLVVHGDMFDLVTKYARWISVCGDIGYDLLLKMNGFANWIQRLFWSKPWSMSAAVKSNVKQAVNFIGDFEKVLVNYGIEKNCQGCICGHIHTADLKLMDNFLYANCGDWVESCTALIENSKGELSLYKHHES